MTNNQHGQVPEALRLAHIFDNPLPPEWPDMVAAAAELRRQHTRIAELEAQIEALSGVQALSAAPEAKKSALRTYPNPIVPLIKPVSEQEKMRALYLASSNLMAYLGRNGAIHSDGHAADVLMNCLNDLDGGEFDETLFAASPTPPAEQQAAPKAEPVKACVCGESQASGTVHRVDGPCYVAAPQQEAQEPVAYVHVPHYTVEGKVRPVVSFDKYQQDYADGIYSTRIPLYAAPQPAPDCHHRPPCNECAAIAAQGGK